jgi:hypothetical protein
MCWATASSRDLGAGAVNTFITSGSGAKATPPGDDMIDVSDSTRSGFANAIVCTIIPPIDQPAMWACCAPTASSTAKPSSAISANV